MFFVQSFFVINLFRIVYSEWIEITQNGHSSSEAAYNNRSLVTNNKNTFDFSTYKDFFSIIEPEMELVKNVETVQKSSKISNKLYDQNGNFHTILANPTHGKLKHPSNITTLKSVFSDSIDQMKVDPVHKIEQKPNSQQSGTIVFKRLEFKPLDFKSILKFLTDMQRSYSLDSLTNIGDKVNFLVQFKDSLLENIG